MRYRCLDKKSNTVVAYAISLREGGRKRERGD
jgi:hypothetical protein